MNAGGASMIYRLMGDADIERIMRYPFTAIASDGGVTQAGRGQSAPALVRHQRAGARRVCARARRPDAGRRRSAA